MFPLSERVAHPASHLTLSNVSGITNIPVLQRGTQLRKLSNIAIVYRVCLDWKLSGPIPMLGQVAWIETRTT